MPTPVLVGALGVIDQIDVGVPGGFPAEITVEEQARGVLEPQGISRRVPGRPVCGRHGLADVGIIIDDSTPFGSARTR